MLNLGSISIQQDPLGQNKPHAILTTHSSQVKTLKAGDCDQSQE